MQKQNRTAKFQLYLEMWCNLILISTDNIHNQCEDFVRGSTPQLYKIHACTMQVQYSIEEKLIKDIILRGSLLVPALFSSSVQAWGAFCVECVGLELNIQANFNQYSKAGCTFQLVVQNQTTFIATAELKNAT